jgi:hypothetical protein
MVWSMVGERERDNARNTGVRHRLRRVAVPPQVRGPDGG